jgi:ribonuclease HII
MLEFDKKFGQIIIGIDEVGRGPLAGPVVAAAIVLDEHATNLGIKDSKKLTAKKREEIYAVLVANYQYGVGIVSPQIIDEINILKATNMAMRQAYDQIPTEEDAIIVDGNVRPWKDEKLHTVVKGDQKSLAIAAASIIAKVVRDGLMAELSKGFPEYLWHKNAGYGTAEHMDAIANLGLTQHHRRSFCRKFLTAA